MTAVFKLSLLFSSFLSIHDQVDKSMTVLFFFRSTHSKVEETTSVQGDLRPEENLLYSVVELCIWSISDQ